MGDADKPFLLWCSFPDPHFPFAALSRWATAYRDADIPLPGASGEIDPARLPRTVLETAGGPEAFRERAVSAEVLREMCVQTLGMISHVDEQIGRVMAALETCGFQEDTVVAFLSDHGEQLGEHGLMYKSYWPYDGCNKVPFVVKVPWASDHGRRVETVVSLLDVTPTVLDLAGVPQPDPDTNPEFATRAAPIASPLPGESLKPVLFDGRPPRRANALIEFDDDLAPGVDLLQMRVLVTDDYKLCLYSPTGEGLLFDRRRDPGERNNLFADPAYATVARELLTELVTEISRTERRFPRRLSGS